MAVTGGVRYTDDDTAAEAGSQSARRHTYNYATLTGSIKISATHMDSVHSDVAIERQPYDFETTSLIRQLRFHRNVDLFGDGSGKRCGVVSATASSFVADSIRNLRTGMRIDVLKTADGSVAGGVSKAVISFNRKTKVVSMFETKVGGTPKSFADGTGADVNANASTYTVYLADSRNKAYFGLDAIVSDANPASGLLYGNIDRSVAGNEFWQSVVLDNGGVPRMISFPLIDEGVAEVQQTSDGEVNLILCSHAVHRQLTADLVAARRIDNATKKLNGWAIAIMHNDIPIVAEQNCPEDQMYLLDTTMFEFTQTGEGDWMDKDGAILARIDGKLSYGANWFHRGQLVCHAPNAQCRIKDLDVTTPET